tara:strand:+ start:53 stop:1144 length:1092 start_codon:yes stop_codon:yes gene_type:complete
MKEIGCYLYNNDFIGKGSFSKVYIGYKRGNINKKYAIKKIYKKDDVKYISYVEKEIDIMKKLNHKNIIKLYDTIYTEKYIYLVLEYCDNDLHSFINKTDLDEEKIKYIIRQITDSLKYIMDNNIVHRDLKPHNILINNNLEIKLCDFGFAREFKDTLLTETICGSPLYMAPEILNNHKYNIKSDIWSLGIIMYEMFMKDHPYKANNIPDLMNKLNSNKPILVNNNINEKCKELIYNLLIIDYNDRIEWDEIFTNEWIYSENESNNNNNSDSISNMDSDNSIIDKEYSFDDCFDSINYEISNDVIKNDMDKANIEYDNNYFEKKNIKNINIMNNVIDDYIVVDKPKDGNIKKIFKSIKGIFNTI